MKKKVLFIDHDDTVFASTKEVHYPSFVEVLKKIRPQEIPLTYEAFIQHCQSHDFLDLCLHTYHFNPYEMELEYKMWKVYTQTHQPKPFEKMKEVLKKFKEKGGSIVVVSHSESPQIERDYLNHFNFKPDYIYGYDLGENHRKPQTYPLSNGLLKLNAKINEALVLDDSYLGKLMAEKMGMDFAWAAWSHSEKFTLKNASDLSFETIDAFQQYLFED